MENSGEGASTTLQAGDTVSVKNGAYRETVDVNQSGSSGSPIVFAAYPGHTPTVSGSDIEASEHGAGSCWATIADTASGSYGNTFLNNICHTVVDACYFTDSSFDGQW